MSRLSSLSNIALTVCACSLLINISFANDSMTTQAIAKRIRPVGQVTLTNPAEKASTSGAADNVTSTTSSDQKGIGKPAKFIYQTYCAACHATGAAGAPKVGVVADWAARVKNGTKTLVKHSISGLKFMPPKGTCAKCSDQEIAATVDYMLSKLPKNK